MQQTIDVNKLENSRNDQVATQYLHGYTAHSTKRTKKKNRAHTHWWWFAIVAAISVMFINQCCPIKCIGYELPRISIHSCLPLKITYFYSFSIDPMPTLSRMKSNRKWNWNDGKKQKKSTQIKTVNLLYSVPHSTAKQQQFVGHLINFCFTFESIYTPKRMCIEILCNFGF